jgi:CBS domain-containing protein
VYEKEEDKDVVEEIGRKIIDNLLEVGFPKCPGNIMSSNPQWVKILKDWRIKIEDWFSKPDAENIMMTSIFFDFRTVFGNIDLEKQLRDFVFKEVKSYKNFLVAMTLKALEFEPPIGLFKDFVVEKSGQHKDELDLKKGGIFPITQGVRVLALENSIPETNTIDRIRKLETKIGKSLSLELIESFKILQTFRLKTQLEKIKEGKYPDNYINPLKLTKIERDLLKDAFKVVKKFQETLGIHFRLRV